MPPSGLNRWTLLASLLGLLSSIADVRPTFADDAAEEADVVAKATTFFEYRDFQKVKEVLEPWVKPPRFMDEKRMIEAHRLLGISLHVLGDLAGAREEFGQLLYSDPLHKLDPFVVPPKVIETFEGVRKEMRNVLDQRLTEIRPRADASAERPVEIAAPPSPILTYLPFGIPQFALDDPGMGLVFLSIQAAALIVNMTSFAAADGLVRDHCVSDLADTPACSDAKTEFRALRLVQYLAFGTALTSWGISAYLGHDAREALAHRPLVGAPGESARKRAALPFFARRGVLVGPMAFFGGMGVGLSVDLP